jgi:hypothetical protein
MILKISSPALTLASVFGSVLVAPSTSHQVAKSVNFAKDPTDAVPQGFDGGTSPNEGQECSIKESIKIREAIDADGIFGCDEDEYCVEDHVSSLGGRCIKFDIEHHEQDFDKTLLAVDSHRLLQDDGIQCTYNNGTAGVKCVGTMACDNIDSKFVKCGSCIGYQSCYSSSLRTVFVGEGSCVGVASCYYGYYDHGEYEEVYWELGRKTRKPNIICL